MTALFVLAQEYRAIADRLADMECDDQTVSDTLESVNAPIEQKAVAVAMVARNFDALAASIKEAEAAMSSRRKAFENRADRLRSYLLANMVFASIKRIESPHFALTVRANPPAVDVFDAAQLPAEYLRQPEPPPPAPDKAAIKEAIKAGVLVPGARITQSQRLDVK